jgi:hypothetical protein
MADAIDIAGEDIHCPMCASLVTPNIDVRNLTRALSAEYTDSDGDEDEDDGLSASNDPDPEDDSAEDDSDYADPDEDDGLDEDEDEPTDDEIEQAALALASDDGDDDDDDDGDSSDDDSAEEASVRSLIRSGKRTRLLASDDDSDEDDGADDEDDSDFDSAVASIRREVAALGLASEDDDEDGSEGDQDDDEGEAETATLRLRRRRILASDDSDDSGIGADSDDDDEEDADVEEAAAQLRPLVQRIYRRRGFAVTSSDDDEQPVAGQPGSDDDVEDMNEEARERIRTRQGSRIDGNRHLKSARSLAGLEDQNVEDDDALDDEDVTPGTDATEGDATDDTEIAGDKAIDWRNTACEVLAIASTPDVRLVVANGIPVARLLKAKASVGVAAQWDTPTLATAFLACASRGLASAEAREFGFKPFTFKLQASDVMRSAMRRSNDLATANAQAEITRGCDRFRQSVKTAAIAAFKGTFSDMQNPLRETLAADLAKLSVVEPRAVIDRAIARSTDQLMSSIFTKAEELAGKSDSARNEVAEFVAKSNYQSRAGVETELAARLDGNSVRVSTAGLAGSVVAPQVATASTQKDQGTLVRRALRSINKF